MAKLRIHPETRDWQLTADRMRWLTAGLALVLLPHALRMPIWVSAVFAVFAGWRLANVTRAVRLPPRWLIAAVSLLMLPGVYLSFGTLTGRTAGVALLTILAGMKLLETRTLRDAFVVSYLGFFLVVTNFLFSQSIPTGLYMLAIVVFLTASLITLTTPPEVLATRARVKLAVRMLLQAAPIMLVLFLLFPRVPGPLWGLPKDARNAVSGLSNSMTPGSISQLSLSDAVAFRVRFDGPTPPPAKLYWRGPVLWHTDGESWKGSRRPRQISPYVVNGERERGIVPRGEPVFYEVTLEPHQRRWLFALEAPTSIPERASISDDLELRSSAPVHERIRYRMRSHPDFRLTGLTGRERIDALRLPEDRHPRTRALALTWKAEAPDARAVVERALTHFRNQPYYYTLSPPILPEDAIDDFLFETRRGFCEHYAAAFTVLMRAAGVPARVVTGYQGGELNALDTYLTVRQSDAHAWTEVWLEDEGWVRVDPTGAVAPSRIEGGLDAAIPPTIGPRSLGFTANRSVISVFRALRQGWDAMNNTWNQWVLGYGAGRQRELLERFGLDSGDYRLLVTILVAGVAVLLLAVAAWTLRRPRPDDPVRQAYDRFCRKLARRGLVRHETEGPVDFATRVERARPELAGEVERITEHYVALRYGAARGSLGELRTEIARFSP